MKGEEWRPIETAPKDATWIEVMFSMGRNFTPVICRAHYAEDLSGEDQPPFRGWFKEVGAAFVEIPEPIVWRPARETRR